MCFTGGGESKETRKIDGLSLLLIWVTLWKNNAEVVFFGLWQQKGLKALSMVFILKQT